MVNIVEKIDVMDYFKFLEKYKGCDFNCIADFFDFSKLDGDEKIKQANIIRKKYSQEIYQSLVGATQEFHNELYAPMIRNLRKLEKQEDEYKKSGNIDSSLNQYFFNQYQSMNSNVSIMLEKINSAVLRGLQSELNEKIEECQRKANIEFEIEDIFNESLSSHRR